MASRNQPNGISPHLTYGGPSPWPAMGGLGSPEPRPRPTAPLPSGINLAYNNAHMNGFGIGRQPSNVPLNSNGAPAFSSQPKWNPSALLNPLGFHSAPQQNAQNGFSNNNPAPQLSFQFDSPAGTPEPSFRTYPSSQRNGDIRQNGVNGNGFAASANGNGNMRGMGNMLERMHNVTERDMVPQKRRRIEDQSNGAQRKAEFNGGGKGGVLGNYMREKKEEGQREARANGTTPVVISALDDDDEVEVVPDAGEKEVCYGRIEGAEISAFKVPTPKPGATALSSGYWPQVKIVLRRRVGERTNTIHAVDSTREIIGCVDVNTSIGLTPLLDSKFGIRTAARILTRQKRDGDPLPGSDISPNWTPSLSEATVVTNASFCRGWS
jgi:hypothetical protein